MPFITLGTASELQIQVPTVGTTDWGDTLRTQTFLKIAQHDHTGSGNGANIAGGALAADSITGAKIRLDNNEFLKARNAGDTANIDIIKVGTTDHLELGAPFKNNTYITARDQADSADLNIWKIDGGDNLDFGTDISRLIMKHDTYIQADNSGGTPTNLLKLDTNNDLLIDPEIGKLLLKNDTYVTARNNADSANVNVLKLDTNDDLAIDPDISKLNLKNSTYLTGRNNADAADVNILRLNTSDKLELGPEIATVVKVSNNLALQHRNNADSAYIDTIKVNASDIIELGAEVDSIQTDTINRGATAVTLTDNTSVAASAGVITLSTDEACTIEYRLVRNGSTQVGRLDFTDVDTIPAESYSGTDVGVTFSVNAGALEYTTTNTGFNASMYYTIIK